MSTIPDTFIQAILAFKIMVNIKCLLNILSNKQTVFTLMKPFCMMLNACKNFLSNVFLFKVFGLSIPSNTIEYNLPL